mmetsp:Transcript_42311/g.104225  ORF Transcript_42311/g.104225 Transcript_42311/m.104225 type:complete len:145 (+) Transcript_42311:316-750(+)
MPSGVTPHMVSCLQGEYTELGGLNAAVDGMSLSNNNAAQLADCPGHVTAIAQARALTDRLSRWPAEDRLGCRWKVLTANLAWGDQLWGFPRDIGRVERDLREVLHHLRDECPYTYLNLLAVPDRASSFANVEMCSIWCGTFLGL